MVLTREQRLMLFLSVCIPLRSLSAVLAYRLPRDSAVSKSLALFFGLAGMCMIYLFAFDKRQSAPEGGGVTWWNSLRPLHGGLYLAFAVSIMMGKDYAYLFLCTDVALGLAAFVSHHYLRKIS